jgi:hypothetical protein
MRFDELYNEQNGTAEEDTASAISERGKNDSHGKNPCEPRTILPKSA